MKFQIFLLSFLCVLICTFNASAGIVDLDEIMRHLDKKIEKAIKDTGQDINKAVKDIRKAIEKASGEIKSINESATRIFSGPKQYPPHEYAAYAIFAFPTRASDADIARYKMFCEAYISAIPHVSEIDIPKNQQLVTVWPIEKDVIANHVNSIPRKSTCTFAVAHYGFLASKSAIDDAEKSGLNLSAKKGPFLIAWAPPTERGQPGKPILYMDLSSVVSLSEAKIRMTMWVDDIESDPELWRDGWRTTKVKDIIVSWANRIGEKILILFAG